MLLRQVREFLFKSFNFLVSGFNKSAIQFILKIRLLNRLHRFCTDDIFRNFWRIISKVTCKVWVCGGLSDQFGLDILSALLQIRLKSATWIEFYTCRCSWTCRLNSLQLRRLYRSLHRSKTRLCGGWRLCRSAWLTCFHSKVWLRVSVHKPCPCIMAALSLTLDLVIICMIVIWPTVLSSWWNLGRVRTCWSCLIFAATEMYCVRFPDTLAWVHLCDLVASHRLRCLTARCWGEQLLDWWWLALLMNCWRFACKLSHAVALIRILAVCRPSWRFVKPRCKS